MAYHVVARPERSREGAFDLHMQANRSTMPLPVIHVMIAAGVALLLLSARFVVIGAWPVAIFSLFSTPIIGLTGTDAQIAQVVKAYHAFFEKVPQPGGDYTIDHTATVYLMGRQGEFVTTIDHQEAQDTALAKLKRLIAAG